MSVHLASLLWCRNARSASCCTGLADALQLLAITPTATQASNIPQYHSITSSWLASSRHCQSIHTMFSSAEVPSNTGAGNSQITTNLHGLTAGLDDPSNSAVLHQHHVLTTSSSLPHSLSAPTSHPSLASLSASPWHSSCGGRSLSLSRPSVLGLHERSASMGGAIRCMATDAPSSSMHDTPATAAPSTAAPTSEATNTSPAASTGSSPGAAATSVAAGSAFSYGPRKVTLLRRSGDDAALEGTIHISNSLNNIHISLTDQDGDIKAWASAGTMGFKNARKRQPIAAERAAEDVARKALKLGYVNVVVKIQGMGNNKQYAVQSLHSAGLRITQLMDVTPVPYNGCRPKKKRRV